MSVSLHVNTSCPTYTNTGADGKADVIDQPVPGSRSVGMSEKSERTVSPPPPRSFDATLFDPLFPLSWSPFQANMRKALRNLQEFFSATNSFACVADAVNRLYRASTDYTNGLDECVGWLSIWGSCEKSRESSARKETRVLSRFAELAIKGELSRRLAKYLRNFLQKISDSYIRIKTGMNESLYNQECHDLF